MRGIPCTEAGPFLSGEEICKILDSAAKSGVAVLKYGSLEMHFAPLAGARYTYPAPGPASPVTEPGNVIQEQAKEEEHALATEEIRTREEQFSELLVTDPLKYEQMLENGDFDTEGSSSDEGI